MLPLVRFSVRPGVHCAKTLAVGRHTERSPLTSVRRVSDGHQHAVVRDRGDADDNARRGGVGETATGRDRALAIGRALAARRRVSQTHQRLALVLSAVIFVVATIVAVRNLPPIDGDIRWGFFVAVGLIGAPARAWVTGAEFGVLAHLTGHAVGRIERLRVALVGIAANLLPIPGSVLVRAQVLRRRGATLRSIGWATAVTGAMWAGTTALVAGVLLGALSEQRLLGTLLATAGASLCAGVTAAILRRRALSGARRHALSLFFVEVLFIAIGGFRLWGIMTGLGYDVGIEQATALTIAGVVTTAVGFAPGGWGVRELTAAAISPIVGLPASVGLLAAALNRLIEMIVLAPASVGMLMHPERVEEQLSPES